MLLFPEYVSIIGQLNGHLVDCVDVDVTTETRIGTDSVFKRNPFL